jgi:hypothetical protein
MDESKKKERKKDKTENRVMFEEEGKDKEREKDEKRIGRRERANGRQDPRGGGTRAH